MGTNAAYFGRVQVAVENQLPHDCAVKFMIATHALMGGILKILNLLEVLPINFGRPTLDLPVTLTGDKYRILIVFCGKFATVSRGIWKNLPRENCGP